ncbi:MAG: PAS domain S-box protein [Ginsengibacter sp.]
MMTKVLSKDFRLLFETTPALSLILLPDFTIAGVTDAYLKATLIVRENALGRGIFEVFPDNPADPEATGVANLRASLNYVVEHRKPHTMAIQKYDIRRPDSTWEVRYWSPVNAPVLNNLHELLYINHTVTDVTNTHAATVQSKQSDKNYQLLVQSVTDYAIFMLDEKGNVASWNSGAESIKGYKAEEIIGKPIDVFYTAEDVENELPQKNLMKTRELGHFESEGRRVRKDGSVFYANVVFTSLIDEEGRFYGYAKVTRDITEKRKAEEHIRLLANIASNIQDTIITTDTHSIITGWNHAAEKLFEWKTDEVIGKSSEEILRIIYPGQTREQILAAFAEKEFWHGELVYHTMSGRPVNAMVTASKLKDGEGNITGSLALVRDITARRKAEDALGKLNKELEQRIAERTLEIETKENRFRALIENISDAIVLNDAESNILYQSPSVERILGYTFEERNGNKVSDYLHPAYRNDFVSFFQEVKKSPGIPLPFQYRFLHKDGHFIWLEGVVTNLINDSSVGAYVANYRDITHRKELEELLRKANSLARIGGWEVDVDKGTIYWSDITKEIHETDFNYLPDLETGINFYKEGVGRELIIQKVKEAIELGKPWDVELQIITAKNNERWVRSIGEPEFSNGKCRRIIGSFQDIDQRKKAEEKLVESEKLYRSLFTNMHHGFAYCKAIMESGHVVDFIYLAVNNEYEKLFEVDDITGKKMSEVLPELLASDADYTGLMTIVATSGKSEKFETYVESLCKWFSVSLYSPGEGYFVLLVDNITERKNAEQNLVASEKQFRNTLDNMLEGAQLIDFDWRYIYVNDSFAKHGKYLKEELIGYTVMEKYPGIENTEIFKIYERCFNERISIHLENEFKFPDNSVGWFELSFQPVPEGIFILSVDITERKKAEREVLQLNEELEQKVIRRTEQLKKSNEELEAFSYSVSHDLRAPLRAIIGFTAILEEDYTSKLDDEAKRITSVIKNNTIKMGQLIDDLLTFSRMGRQELVKAGIDTNSLVEEVINSIDKKENGIAIDWNIHELPDVKADINTIRQVWVNYISNAIKYSSKKTKPIIEIGSHRENGQTVFFVKDNGVGFNEKYGDKLFKVFQRLHGATEFEGTGVGLAIVDKIISKHEGKVWAKGEVNKGACFYFSLPFYKK